jgi:hypothetical protein
MKKLRVYKVYATMLILIFGISIFGQIAKTDTFKITEIKREIGDITVVITQYKTLIESSKTPYCKAFIKTIKQGKEISSLNFSSIEPVGDDYGFFVYSNLIKNHLLISKFGDYDGSTIIINSDGQIFSTIGGNISVDLEAGLVFSIYASDLTGFSVFDLVKDSVIIKMVDIEERPVEFYKSSNANYYFLAKDDETNDESVWEIEFDLERILNVDIDAKMLKDKNLKLLVDYKEVKINCE